MLPSPQPLKPVSIVFMSKCSLQRGSLVNNSNPDYEIMPPNESTANSLHNKTYLSQFQSHFADWLKSAVEMALALKLSKLLWLLLFSEYATSPPLNAETPTVKIFLKIVIVKLDKERFYNLIVRLTINHKTTCKNKAQYWQLTMTTLNSENVQTDRPV